MSEASCVLCQKPARTVWVPTAKPSWRPARAHKVCVDCSELISAAMPLFEVGEIRLCTSRVPLAHQSYGLCTAHAIVTTGQGVTALCPDHLLRLLHSERRSHARIGRDTADDPPLPALVLAASRLSLQES